MTQKLTLAALVFSAATTAGATCTKNQIAVGECGDVPDPRQTTTQPPITVNTQVTPVIAVSPTLSSTGTNTLDATVQGNNTLNGAVNGTNTGYVSGTNTNNNNFDPNNTNYNANANHNAANSAVTVGQGALSPTANAAGGNSYSGATGGTGMGGESRSTATGVGGNQSQNQAQALDNRNTINASTGPSTSGASTGPVTNGDATANAAPQTQTFAPVSNSIYKEARNPVNTALAPTLFAAQGGEGMESLGSWSLAAQLVGFGGSGGVNHGTKFSEGWAQFKLTSQALASPNPAVRLFGLTAAAEQHPKTFGVALVGVREAVTSGDPLLGALSDNYRVAAAPATVTVVDNTPKNPCADKPGTTPVWNGQGFDCRRGGYNYK